jgi:hypothetical protein
MRTMSAHLLHLEIGVLSSKAVSAEDAGHHCTRVSNEVRISSLPLETREARGRRRLVRLLPAPCTDRARASLRAVARTASISKTKEYDHHMGSM